jgi:hypothetical protein
MLLAPVFSVEKDFKLVFRFCGILILLIIAYVIAKEWHKRRR